MLNDLAALYSENITWFTGSVFIIGLIVGSFLNVVIYRLPIILDRQWQEQATEMLSNPAKHTASVTEKAIVRPLSLSFPRSVCPACNAPIAAWQNIPVFSWLVLRGKCAACKTSISARYPLVECITAVLSGWVAWHFGYGCQAACALILTWALIALTGIDVDHQLLPDDITLPLLWAGLLAAIWIGPSPLTSLPVSPNEAIAGAASGYLSLWLVFHAFRLVTGKEGMGYGDFKLLAALGAWMGWKLLPLIIVLSAATGAIWGVFAIVSLGRDRAVPMPFGPYLAAAGWLAMMYGNSLVNGYLRLAGLQH